MVFHASPLTLFHSRGFPKYAPPSNSRTNMMSVPSMTSGRSGLLTVNSLNEKHGRRFANPPSAARIANNPPSGRLSGASELNSLPPTAPSKTASDASAASSVSWGSGVPSATMATPPMRFSINVKSWPPSAAVSFNTATASLVTSGPMPSPATTNIFSFIPTPFSF